jgi:sortase A
MMKFIKNLKGKSGKDLAVNGVLVLTVLVSVYLIVAPIAPAVEFYLRDNLGWEYEQREVSSENSEENVSKTGNDNDFELGLEGKNEKSDYYKDNVIQIPKIGVDMDIVEGSDDSALDQGAWIRPNASEPNLGSNTVITAHRFSYLDGGNSFYNLDKVKKGDEVLLFWKGDKYRYVVEDSFIVEPSEIEVEDPTDSPILTLYTCTPLWTASKRLVVTAVPDDKTDKLINTRKVQNEN